MSISGNVAHLLQNANGIEGPSTVDAMDGRRFRDFLEHLPDPAFEVGLDGTILWLNNRVEHLIGYPRAELLGTPFSALIAPESLKQTWLQIGRIAAGESVTFDLVVLHRSGRRVEISASASPTLVNGQVVGLYGVARDITEQRQTERRIADQSARLQALADCSAAFAGTLDLDTVFRTVAHRVSNVLGDLCVLRLLNDDGELLDPVAVAARDDSVLERIGPVPSTRFDDPTQMTSIVMRTGEPVLLPTMEPGYIRKHLDATYQPRAQHAPVESMLIVPLRVRGATIGTMSIVSVTPGRHYSLDDQHFLQDLAGRAAQSVDNARLHRATRDAEVRFRALVEHLPAMTYIGALDERIMSDEYMSPQIFDILGYTVEEYLADPDLWMRSVHADDRARVEEHVAQAIRGETPIDVEYRMFRRDGELCWLHSRASIAIQDDQPLWWQGIVFDVTDRKRAEEALHRSEQRFRAASEASFDAVVIIQAVRDTQGAILDFRFVEANSRASSILRRPIEQIIGATMREFYPLASAESYIKTYTAVLQSGAPRQEEYTGSIVDGQQRWY